MKQQCQTIKITSPSDSDGLPALVQIKLLTQSEGPCKITPKQNRPSLEQTPEADNAGSFHFQRSWSFTTMFPPDSMPSACSRTCSLNRRIGYSCSPGFGDSIFSKIPTGSPWLWPMPAMRTSSSSPQAQTTGLTISVEDWIKSCLQRKRGSSAAVVALLGPEPDMDGQDSPRLQFLEGVARKAGLDFFAPKSRCRHQFLDDHQIAGKNRKADSPKRKGHIGYKGIRPGNVLASCCISTMIWLSAAQAQAQTAPTNSASDEVLAWRSANTNIWENGVGEGFKRGVQSVSFDAGAGYGIKVFGGKQSHDLALQSISYGCTLGPVEGDGHWYRGNWEFRGELFSGAQFVPTTIGWWVSLRICGITS